MTLTADYSDTGLCNRALLYTGNTNRIADIETDDSEEARRLRELFVVSRDAFLRGYDWNYARRRVALPPHGADPAFGFAKQYLLPNNYLMIRRLPQAGIDDKWEIEDHADGKMLLTDIGGPLQVIYTARQDNLERWDPLAFDAFAASLAFDVAPSLTGTASKLQTIASVMAGKLELALARDSQEGTGDERMPEGEWFQDRGFSTEVPLATV